MSAARRRYLEEMGIPAWVLRRPVKGAPAAVEIARPAVESGREALEGEHPVVENVREAAERAPRAVERIAHSAGESVAEMLGNGPRAIGGDSDPSPLVAEAGAAPGFVSTGMDWETLAAEVAACTRCPLHRARKQAVFGVGRRDASLLVVGEAPGAEEDRQGEPFVGPAGQLLNQMLRAIGFARDQVYIANVLKCRPPNNRDPRPEEADACASHLNRQIALIQPRAMLAVGRISAQRLLGTELPVGRLRGVVHRYGETGIPLVVTYHPAYLLRSPIEKAKSWQDLCMLIPLLASAAEADP